MHCDNKVYATVCLTQGNLTFLMGLLYRAIERLTWTPVPEIILGPLQAKFIVSTLKFYSTGFFNASLILGS